MSENATPSAPIKSIKVGARHRKDLGDLGVLAASIRELGLLHPIVVTPNLTLIAGERRLRACEQIGMKAIPIRIVDLAEIVKGEFAENAIRKDFLPSERVAIGEAIEELEKVAAKERQVSSLKKGSEMPRSGKFPEREKGQTRDKVAAYTGVSGRTHEKEKAVVASGRQDLIDEMDRTGKVDGAYRKLKQQQDEQRILSVAPAVGKFKTLIIDPPWDHEGLSLAGRGRPEYAVMSQEELLAMDVAKWADDNCHLYLWTTNNFIIRAGALIEPWGFAFKTVLTWVKPRIGLGSYFRSSTEQCLFAVRGSLTTRVNDIPTHFEAPLGEHSEKPEEFYNIVRRASYPPYGEVFQRLEKPDFANLFVPKEAA